jgi:hypothetical protein
MFVKYSIEIVTGLLHLSSMLFNLNTHKTLQYTGSYRLFEFQKFISTLYRS